MSAQLDQPLTPELRDILGNLSVGLFDLDTWVKEVGKYEPPDKDELPWRKPGGKLTMADLRVIPFFENLLRESSGDDDLGTRWSAVMADPLKFSPLPNALAWRKNRGLNSPPKFGITASNNVWLTDASGKVISRATFYALCWQPLKAVVDARQKAGPIDWVKLAQDLLNNNAPQWPPTLSPTVSPTVSPTSASFLIQFASDMLYAMLGQRNPSAGVYERAVLKELGEFRHPGNEYTRTNTNEAVKKFEDVANLGTKRKAPHGNR